jgi:hypothetical protein
MFKMKMMRFWYKMRLAPAFPESLLKWLLQKTEAKL